MSASSDRTAGQDRGGLDVLLVSMPFAPARNPSLGLSLLKAAAPERRVAIRYFTLPFADRIGATLYEHFSAGDPSGSMLVGEAIFRNALFPASPRPLARYLRAAVRRADRSDARLLDAAVRAERRVEPFLRECVRSVLDLSPRIVGFTSLFQQQIASLALAARLKAARPDLFVVIGGSNCDGPAGPELASRFPFLDAVVSGEADAMFPEIVERVLSGRSVAGLQGVYTPRNSRTDAGRAAVAAPCVQRLDTLPVPDYSDFFAQWASSRIARQLDPRVLFETSRGCWWGEKHHCTFCGVNGPRMTFRRKSATRAVAEFRHTLSRVPTRTVLVCDSVLDSRAFDAFLAALARRRPRATLAWAVRPNVRKEQLRRLFAAGVGEIEPGVESFSDAILSLMDKGVTALQNVQMLKWCAEIGVRPIWKFIWGFPGEPPDEYARMIARLPLLAHLPPPHSWGPIQLQRFSPNFEQAAARGFTNVAPWPAYSFLYPFGRDSVANLAHSFVFSYADGRRVEDYSTPLVEALRRWRRVHARAGLTAVDLGRRLLIADTRPSSGARLTMLEGRMRDLYLACDGVRTLASLAREAAAQDRTAQAASEIGDDLAPLVEAGLMLRDGDRVLSLAVRGRQRGRARGTRPPTRRARPGSA